MALSSLPWMRQIDEAGPVARTVCVIGLAIAVAMIHLVFFRPFLTAQIFDEVAHLVSAKYIFSDVDLGFYGWTMKGHSLLLYVLALPFGGLDRYSTQDAYNLSWIANIAMSALFVPLTYAFLRDFGIGFAAALLGAATVASLPMFYVYTPLAMTEMLFATLCMLYLFVLMRFLARPLAAGMPYLVATLALTAALTATKAVGTYELAMACALVLLLYRINIRTIVLIVLSAIVITLVRQTRMMFGYNVELSFANILPHLAALAIGLTASVCISLIYFAPLVETASLKALALRGPTSPLRGNWRGPAPEQAIDAEWRAFTAFILATVGFLGLSIGVSALFHGMIDRFTNYRTVASVIPVFLAATLAFVLARAEDANERTTRSRVLAAGIRVLMVLVLFATLFAMKALDHYFTVDNFFDFVTVLPVYDYMTQPFRSRASLWLAGLGIALALVSLFPWRAVRMAGLIAINAGLFGCYLMSPWISDKNRAVYYGTNLRMFEEVAKLEPKFVNLLDFPPDVQWLHFGYPYAWRDAANLKFPILGAGNEALIARGIGVARFPVINAEFLQREPAGTQQFLSYDLDRPRMRDVPRAAIADLVKSGNTVNLNPPDTSATPPFAYAQPNAMFGPFILPAGETTRVTLWAAGGVAEERYRGCTLVAGKSKWPLDVASAAPAPSDEWVLAADVTPDESLFGLLRLDCPATAMLNRRPVTLPVSGLSVTRLPRRP